MPEPIISTDPLYQMLRNENVKGFNAARKQGKLAICVTAICVVWICAAPILASWISGAHFRGADLRGIDFSTCIMGCKPG